MMMPERKNYPQLGEVKAPYVHAVKHGATLYVSGLTAFGTAAQQGDMAEQAEAIFDQLRAVAAAEHTSLASLLKVTIFITSFTEITALGKCFIATTASICPPARWYRSADFSPLTCA